MIGVLRDMITRLGGGMVNAVLAFELETIAAEIDEQADVQTGCNKIIDELGLMPGVEKLAGFEFQDDCVSDYDIGYEVADRLSAI